jgi:hypothetical protein
VSGVTKNERQRARGSSRLARSQERPVSGAEVRTRNLSAHDGELVPEHDDLEFLELLRTETQNQELEDKAKRELHERWEHKHGLQVDAARAARLYADSRG